MIVFFYKNDGRKLKNIITWLLKSWAATKITRINYAQSYTLHDNKIQKTEEKLVIIEHTAEQQKKIEAICQKSDICRTEIKDIHFSKKA